MRRKDDTLRDTLVALARELAEGEGIGGVNIRALAQSAGVAAVTVYNYFSGKEELLLALTEEYWGRRGWQPSREGWRRACCGGWRGIPGSGEMCGTRALPGRGSPGSLWPI